MTGSLIAVPRPFWIIGIVALLLYALYLDLPGTMGAVILPAEHTHADPEMLADFRQGLTLIDKMAARLE